MGLVFDPVLFPAQLRDRYCLRLIWTSLRALCRRWMKPGPALLRNDDTTSANNARDATVRTFTQEESSSRSKSKRAYYYGG